MRYLVDADWLIDAAAGRQQAVRTLDHLRTNGLAVSIIAVAELYEGAFGTADPDAMLVYLRKFLGGYAILPVTDPIVEHFARMRDATPARQTYPGYGSVDRGHRPGCRSYPRHWQRSPL